MRRKHHIYCSRKRVARLMREAGLVGVHRRRNRGSTRRDPARPSYSDLVKREFTPSTPDRLWVADITQHKTGEGWLYLAVVIDAYSRKVVGWSMAEHLQAELVIKALEMAVWNRRPSPGLVHHSDHGSQGGFKRSSQHLGGGVAWEGRRVGVRLRLAGQGCGRRGSQD